MSQSNLGKGLFFVGVAAGLAAAAIVAGIALLVIALAGPGGAQPTSFIFMVGLAAVAALIVAMAATRKKRTDA